MKTSIRLAITSFAVSCITLAAAGTPLPSLGSAPATASQRTAAMPVALDAGLAGVYAYRSPGPFALE